MDVYGLLACRNFVRWVFVLPLWRGPRSRATASMKNALALALWCLCGIPHASSFAVPGTNALSTAHPPLQRSMVACMQEDEAPAPPPPPPPPVYPPPEPRGPDMFIPIFVATALGGYGLILVFDAAVNGFCVPFIGQCFGVPDTATGVWGS